MSDVKELAAKLGDILDPSLRTLTDTAAGNLRPYDRYGAPIEGMHWIPLSVDIDGDLDIFLLKMEPGAQSRPHEHVQVEQFLVLEGALRDCDGTVMPAGTFARFEAGSLHFSTADETTGCVLLTILRGRNRALDANGK